MLAALACAAPTPERSATTTSDGPPAAPRARGQKAAMKSLALTCKGGRLSDDQLHLDLAFENTSDSSFALAGDLTGEDFRLIAGAQRLRPLAASPDLDPIDPQGGFGPGSRKTGWLAFPRPRELARLRLELPGFEPLPVAEELLTQTRQRPGETAVARARRDRDRRADEETAAALERLVAQQAAALASSDYDAYLDTFVNDFGVREQERQIFYQAQLLPLAEVEMEVGPGNWAAFSTRQGQKGRRVPVRLAYRLKDLPADNPFLHRLLYRFRREDGSWRVGRIEDDKSQPVVWRRQGLVFHPTHRFLIYGDPRARKDLVDVAAQLEGAYAALHARGFPMAHRYVIHHLANRQEYERIAESPDSLGVAVARLDLVAGEPIVHSRTFYVNGGVFLGRNRRMKEARQTVITHELVHLALAGLPTFFAPGWLKEGAAVYFSGDVTYEQNRDLAGRGLGHLSLRKLSGASELSHAERQQTLDEYLYSGNVVAYLVERGGQKRFLDFYGSYAEVSAQDVATFLAGSSARRDVAVMRVLTNVPAPEPESELTAAATDRGLRRYYGLTIEELEAAVKKRLTDRYG